MPFAEQLPLGANLALEMLGGEVVAAEQEEQMQGWSARRLIDGLVSDAFSPGARGSVGFTTRANVTFPLDITLRLGGGRAARIVGIGIDPSFKFKQSGILDSDFLGDPSNRPRRFEILTSGDGQSWRKVLEGELRNRNVRQVFRFEAPQTARLVRFRFVENFGGDRLQLGELEVYEDPALDSTQSLAAAEPLNILRPEVGGAVVDVTSQYAAGEAFVGHLADGEPRSIWSPGDGWRFPQRIVMAFAGTTEALIDAVEIVPREADKRPKTVVVRRNLSDSPTSGWELVGRFTAPDGASTWRISFDQPLRARFLELSIVESEHPNYVQIGELRIIEARRPGYRSVVARAREEQLARQRALTAPADALAVYAAGSAESEPNDRPETADPVELGQSIAGRIEPLGEEDFFRLEAPPAETPLRLKLEGRPALQVRLQVMGEDGRQLLALGPEPSRQSIEASLATAGPTLLRMSQPRTRIVLVVDKSGSMEDRIDDARAAVRRFIAGLGGQEEVALLVFSTDINLAHDFSTDRKSLDSAAVSAIRAGGGTALYDAMLQAIGRLKSHPGNRAIILLSDGADGNSTRASAGEVMRELVDADIRLYAIALGDGMSSYRETLGKSAGQMLDFWARASGGRILTTPSASELGRLYEAIGAELRTGTRYRLRASRPEGKGRLVVRQTGERIAGVGTPNQVLLILDASGSMRGRDRTGATKMETARQVLKDLVRSLPDDVKIGLRVYGLRYPSKPKARSCTDTALIVPFQRLNRQQFAAFLDQIQPRGQTPIGLSLRQVTADFGGQPGKKIVVLVTDGEETCSPKASDPDYPPKVVDELRAKGVDLRVNIVGFDIDKKETRDFLAALAARTGGLFASADDAASLGAALERALRAPFHVEDTAGNVLARGTLDGGALELPAGVFRVVIEAEEPIVLEDVRIENGLETRIDINREGEEIAVDRRTGAIETALSAATGAKPGRVANAAQVEALLEEAEAFMAARKLTTPENASALSRYQAVLALDPQNARAKAGLSRIVEAYLELAEKAEARNDLKTAAEYYGRALLAWPDNVELLLLRGLAYLQSRDYQRAERDFGRALELSPDSAEAGLYLGLTRLSVGNPSGAVGPLRKAWQDKNYDDRFRAGYLLAGALASSERLEDAYDVLSKTISEKGDCESAPLDRLCTDLWAMMVQVLGAMGKGNVAMETLQPLLDLEPAGPAIHDAFAELFRASGQEARARQIEADRLHRFGN
ncbi:MAG: VWA domain-containing protein [Candidatus Dadabacteria bacterium]|nr:MAG: VWA domain-containing protein [Candidatus Dadabacteria bacterium]